MPDPRDVAAGLLETAREEAAAVRVIAGAEVPDRIVGFHAQQAVEMFLKAVLASRAVSYERTHDIERLAFLTSEGGLGLPADIDVLAQLTPMGRRASVWRSLRPGAAGSNMGRKTGREHRSLGRSSLRRRLSSGCRRFRGSIPASPDGFWSRRDNQWSPRACRPSTTEPLTGSEPVGD